MDKWLKLWKRRNWYCTVKYLFITKLCFLFLTAAMVQDSSVVGKYQSGFSECASEVSRYLSTIDGLPSEVRCRLLDHLSTCVHKVSGAANAYQQYPTAVTYPTATPLAAMPGSIGEVPLGGAFQLMPTTLPNGQIVLIPQNIGATTPLYVQAQEGDRRQSISSPEARDRYGSVSSPGSDDSRSVSLSSSPESDRWGSPPLREQPRGHSPVNMPSTQPPRSYCHSSLSVDHNMNLPNPVKRESSHRSDLPHCEVKPSPVLRQRSENIHIIPKDLSGHKHAEQGPVKHHVIKQEPVNTAPRPEVRYHQVPVVCEENMWRPWWRHITSSWNSLITWRYGLFVRLCKYKKIDGFADGLVPSSCSEIISVYENIRYFLRVQLKFGLFLMPTLPRNKVNTYCFSNANFATGPMSWMCIMYDVLLLVCKNNRACRTGGHYWNCSIDTLSFSKVSAAHLKIGVPINFIYAYPIFKWVALMTNQN